MPFGRESEQYYCLHETSAHRRDGSRSLLDELFQRRIHVQHIDRALQDGAVGGLVARFAQRHTFGESCDQNPRGKCETRLAAVPEQAYGRHALLLQCPCDQTGRLLAKGSYGHKQRGLGLLHFRQTKNLGNNPFEHGVRVRHVTGETRCLVAHSA